MNRDRDSDDDFDTGLPKMPKESVVVGEINLRELREGKSVSFGFDMPESLETEGYQQRGRDPPAGDKILNMETLKQLELKFLSTQAFPEELKAMFGDYTEIESFMEPLPEWGSIKKRLLRPGTGKVVKDGNMVVVHYMVGAEPMDDLIESTYSNKRPRRFRVGAGEVLAVMDIGVATMRVGEIAKFLAPAELSYGTLGIPLMEGQIIPPDSRVMLQLEVLETYICEKDESITKMSTMERQQLPFQEIFAYAEAMKNDGNREFLEAEFERSIPHYVEALEAIKDMQPATLDQKAKYFKLRLQVCNNTSQAYFKLGKVKRALKYAEGGTEVPINGHLKAKSFYCYAKCLFELGRYELSLFNIKKADMLWHDNNIKDLKRRVEEKLKECEKEEKELCSRMMMASNLTDKSK